jgi:tripartite-type tricarboxylate transporter receptor subunit TctC
MPGPTRRKCSSLRAGTGSAVHLACVLFNAAIGVQVTHIPYRGTGPALQDMIGGRIDYQCPVASAVVPQVESNQVKAIAVLTRQRAPNLPDLATAQEQGLAGFEAGIWFAMFLPKGTPAAVVHKLQRAALATVDTPSVQEKLRAIGGLPDRGERDRQMGRADQGERRFRGLRWGAGGEAALAAARVTVAECGVRDQAGANLVHCHCNSRNSRLNALSR